MNAQKSNASRMNSSFLFEGLEQRTLRSATLVGTELRINGTHSNDQISVFRNASDATKLEVRVRNDVQEFNVSDVSRIVIRSGTGNDRVSINEANGAIKIQSKIYGGAGNDVVTGGSGRDRVYGGDGNDSVSGSGGSDVIYGEAGDDSINGNNGDDLVDGGLDDDTVHGNKGDDHCDGGDGDDHVNGDDGNDSVDGEAGDDSVVGGGGHDDFSKDDNESEHKDQNDDDTEHEDPDGVDVDG